MNLRLRFAFVTVLVAITIITFGVGTGLIFVEGNLEYTIQKDMEVVATISDKLLSTETDYLTMSASMQAQLLLEAIEDNRLEEALQEQVAASESFIALSIVSRDSILASYGVATLPKELISSKAVELAFAGESEISSTRIDPESRQLVFQVCVPMGEYVLSATLPGMHFSDLLANVAIWETGNIFIVDTTGMILANVRPEWVLNQYNFIRRAESDPQYQRVANTVAKMIQGKRGWGKFAVDGKERICVYSPISGSKSGWSLGVVAPIEESPIRNVNNGLLLVGGVCLLLAVIASIFASKGIASPYATISLLKDSLLSQEDLAITIHDTAATLLQAKSTHYVHATWKCMDSIAQSARVDRMRIWKNHETDGKLFCSQVFEWSGGAEPLQGRANTIHVSYSEKLPTWEGILSSGACVQGLVNTFSPEVQAQLSEKEILSILVVPVFFEDLFWGFVAFDNCKKEREFSRQEQSLLQSGALLVATAVLRNEITQEMVHAREEVQANAMEKANFLANVSKKMRTPLNEILSLPVALLDAAKGYAADALAVVDEIRDISEIEAGEFELEPIEYDVPKFITSSIESTIAHIGPKPIRFQVNVSPNLPTKLYGDENRVRQIFRILLSNAFKFTTEGEVTWTLSCEANGEDVWLISTVRDTGMGMRHSELSKLFSRQKFSDLSDNPSLSPTGLGLIICKNSIDLMDGQIAVESKENGGSVFSIRIRQDGISDMTIGQEVADSLQALALDASSSKC
jgi:signal transduction histidine kinase